MQINEPPFPLQLSLQVWGKWVMVLPFQMLLKMCNIIYMDVLHLIWPVTWSGEHYNILGKKTRSIWQISGVVKGKSNRSLSNTFFHAKEKCFHLLFGLRFFFNPVKVIPYADSQDLFIWIILEPQFYFTEICNQNFSNFTFLHLTPFSYSIKLCNLSFRFVGAKFSLYVRIKDKFIFDSLWLK